MKFAYHLFRIFWRKEQIFSCKKFCQRFRNFRNFVILYHAFYILQKYNWQIGIAEKIEFDKMNWTPVYQNSQRHIFEKQCLIVGNPRLATYSKISKSSKIENKAYPIEINKPLLIIFIRLWSQEAHHQVITSTSQRLTTDTMV